MFARRETWADVVRGEIQRMRRATDETQSHWRKAQFEPPTGVAPARLSQIASWQSELRYVTSVRK